jgi:methylphosphotriester-DNA--protein-cysteine methyltransferase
VASSRGHVYYRVGCSGARKLSPANLVYFKTEDEAQKAGYRHSATKGC